ncbi:hypothetical protein OH76DRAFT_1366364 [Lentinus brumalis]|uniref:Tc1-like transposase DDE domain-containing protein n=1 Tax=Lentinus brumalis TaxID=2498619 RepID=A0A371CJ68_9APHY|nr:hypothetical protein OH76DRAFT_1366364 [Polyporus brumalis]
MSASVEAAECYSAKTSSWARCLRKWARAYIQKRTLPSNPYGKWTRPRLDDEGLSQEIHLHLQSLGKYVRALDVVHYLDQDDVKKRWSLKKTISVVTAQRWMKLMGYRWQIEPKGQYADGHEREDVQKYRQETFIPAWNELETRMRNWSKDGTELGSVTGRVQTVWFHDESIFYENDRRKKVWWHKSESPKPYKKGDGASLMVADVFSPDHGWLRSKEGLGTQTARVLLKPGSGREGYFDSEGVLSQAKDIMDILDQYPDEDHTVVYDNAKTHTKRADDALSARRMPKNIPKEGSNWGVEVIMRDTSGQPVYASDGTTRKVKVHMHGAQFSDGRPQDLYFPPDHPQHPGKFKGMACILQEQGYGDMSKVRAECKGFKCPKDATRCCCRRMLFNEPDFANVESLLEAAYRARGYKVLLLPKFHCELNPIEQCWGAAKRKYRVKPPSKGPAALEQNVTDSLASVKILQMRRFATHSRRFIDAYRTGLNGKQAAWADKTYRSHRCIPKTIMRDLDKAGLRL